MAMMKISASFPPWDGRPCSDVTFWVRLRHFWRLRPTL